MKRKPKKYDRQLSRKHYKIVSEELLKKRRADSLQDHATHFYCREDLVAIWDATNINGILNHLSQSQRVLVKDRLLLFISFLLCVSIDLDWLAHFEYRLFESTSEQETLKFNDDDGPRTEEELRNLNLDAFQVSQWKRQYEFRPVEIQLTSEASEGITQAPLHCPLSFEAVNDGNKAWSDIGTVGNTTSGYDRTGIVRVGIHTPRGILSRVR